LIGELEHLKIETRLIAEMFPSVMGEYVFGGSGTDHDHVPQAVLLKLQNSGQFPHELF
jgi:hypothetical protein